VQDIRVDDSFFGHPKTVRFIRRTGDHGITCLFRLWCYTSRYFPKGILTVLNAVEIADAAGWKGDPEEFVSALLDAGGPGRDGFLDKCGSHYGLHNWRKRNPFAYFRDERSEVSRKAAETRWDKKKKGKQKPEGDAKSKAERNADSNAERNAPSPAPSPIPSPTPIHKDLGAERAAGVLEAPAAPAQEREPPPPNPTLPKCSTCDGPATTKFNGRPRCWKCLQAENEGTAAKEVCIHRWLASGVCRLCFEVREEGPIPGIGNIGAIK
jgi:hypothetical protein